MNIIFYNNIRFVNYHTVVVLKKDSAMYSYVYVLIFRDHNNKIIFKVFARFFCERNAFHAADIAGKILSLIERHICFPVRIFALKENEVRVLGGSRRV